MLSSQAISNYYHSFWCGISCHYLLLRSLSSVSTGRTQFCITVECAGSSKMTDSSYPRMATFPCCLNPCRMFLAWFILKVLIITLSTNKWWKGPLWSHNTEAAVLGNAGIVFSPPVFSAASRESEWQGWTEHLPELTWPCLRRKRNSDLTSTSDISFWIILSNRFHSCLSHSYYSLKMNQIFARHYRKIFNCICWSFPQSSLYCYFFHFV